MSWAASGITAVEGDDYLVSGDTVTVPAGTALAELEVEVLGDALDEPNETLDVEILDVSGNAVLGGDVTARVTITDDDATPRISVDDVSAGEGDCARVHGVVVGCEWAVGDGQVRDGAGGADVGRRCRDGVGHGDLRSW